jgi:signal transduction histidine kinase
MHPLQHLGDRLRFLWNGPDDLPRSLKLEWRFVAVRWLGIASLAPVLLLAHLPLDRLVEAYLVLIVASVYNAGLQQIMPRRPQWLANGYISTIGDALLDIAIIVVGGGFDSPFYFILFTVTLAAAMRYGYGPSLGVALLYVSADGIGYLASQQPVGAGFVVRSLLLPLTTILAGYLREQAQQAEAALQERLRQSNALNEVTGMLGATLELDAVLRSAVAATAQLFGSNVAVLQASSGLDSAASLREPIFFADGGANQCERALERLCQQYARRGLSSRTDDELISIERLSTGEQAIVLELALPTRQISLATIAVAVPATKAITLDSDILDSFVERITLAVENASLYRTLADRSVDLQRAYSDLATAHQELLSVDEMKTNFLANVSHELRTPLTSIRAFAEILQSYPDDEDTQAEFLQIIVSESERLTRLVNDVLDVTKIESGEIEWRDEPISPTPLLEQCARTFGPLFEASSLVFKQEVPQNLPAIRGDYDRLQQVIHNLLNNAMKFTAEGTIALRASILNGELHIAVSDTGVGIAAADQERVFEKFQQVGDTLTGKPKGTGLGLTICRDIVAHHGGQLLLDSQPGRGSTFTIALPIAVPASVPDLAVAA